MLMTSSTSTSIHQSGSPSSPASKPPDISISSLFRKVGPRLLLLFVMLLSVLLGFAQFAVPAVVPKSAPATEFSAERAMAHLQVIAQQSRLIGSPGNAQTREYLMQQITAMELHPEVQTTTVTLRPTGWDTFQTGTVHTVVARLKGTDSTRAILLDAHYDSGATGPGASDEGSGVVTLLETMRALTAGPPLKNDVIFVFADGEERDMLGAHGFATQHPWMQDVGLALNFEAGGNQGPTEMYMTSQQNGWLINEFLRAAPAPLASSFLNNLAWLFSGQRLGCDLEEYMARGSAGLDFLYIGNTPVYHTVLDNVHTIDPSSIQHEGSSALALVRHFGAMDPSEVPTAPNDVVFNILPGVVHYPGTWAVPLAVGVLLLLLGVLVLGFRRKHLTVGGFALGTFIFLASLFGALALSVLGWVALKAVNPAYQVAMAGSYYGSDLVVLGLTALVIAVMSAFYLWLRGRMRLYNLAAGALIWWVVLMVLSSLFFPGGSYLFTWPLLASVLALGWLFITKEPVAHPWLRAGVLSVASVPGIVLLTSAIIFLLPLATRFDVEGGIPTTPVPIVFVALLMGLLIPQLDLLAGEPHKRAGENHPTAHTARRRVRTSLAYWLVPISAFLIGIVVLGAAIGTSGFSASRPGTDQIRYQLNADTGQAIWQSDDQRLDAWTRQFFPSSTGQGPFQAKAPSVALAAPTASLLSDTLSGGTRTLRVQVASPRHAAYATVIVAASLDGHPFDLNGLSQSTRQRLEFSYYGLPDQGFELMLRVASAAPVKITVQDLSNGLPNVPGMTIKPRPAYLMPAPRDWLDPTIVVKLFTFAR
jgi:MFS family permease